MKALAFLMVAVGFLLTGLSGLCTAVFSVQALVSAFRSPRAHMFPLVIICLVIGAPFIAGGVALMRGGLRIWDKRPMPPRGQEDVF